MDVHVDLGPLGINWEITFSADTDGNYQHYFYSALLI